jgi:O-antigen ligase
MFFTFSRGAWVALAIGLVVAIAVDPRRLQLIAVGAMLSVWPVLAIAAAHRRHGLTLVSSTFEQATHDGHSLFPLLLAFAAGGAATALIAGIIERRVGIPSGVRRVFAAVVIAAALGGAGAVWVTQGSPWTLAQRGWNQFKTPPERKGSADVTQRLFSLRSNGRFDLWRVSLQSFERKPLTGNGAGTFWELWAQNRHIQALTLEAHSLYLQMLGELGLPGLLLIAAALLTPFVAALRRRAQTLVAPALGAYVAWLVHSGVDWDWDLMAVGACGLLIGVGLLGPRDRTLPRRSGAIGVVACVVLALLAFEGLLGDRAINAAQREIARDDHGAALADLRRAGHLAPWSSRPDTLRASTYLLAGNRRLARRYFLRALAKDRQSWYLWSVLASVTSGREQERDLAEAHRLNPFLGS